MNGYDLTRNWYNFKFDNCDKAKAVHTDLYIYIVDQWNRLGQKSQFGLPTQMTMQCLGIGSYNTYKKALQDLIDFGFIKLVKDSKNQHQSKLVALSKFDKATDKPLDKATIKAIDEAPDNPSDKPTDTIIEQEILNKYNNLTTEQINNILGFADSLSSEELISFISSLKKEKSIPNQKNKIDFSEVARIFNEVCISLPAVTKISKSREYAISARAKEYDLETIGKVFTITSNSPFLNGQNDRNWKADFDWILKQANFLKILEGKYQSNGKSNTPTAGQSKVQYSDDFKGKIASRLQS